MLKKPSFPIDPLAGADHRDPISDVLALVEPRAHFSASLSTGGDWAIDFPGNEGLTFCALVRGRCWLAAEAATPLPLNEGDCFLITKETPYRLASDLELQSTDARALYAGITNGRAAYHPTNTAGLDATLLGGRFSFDKKQTSVLLGLLPPVVMISSSSKEAAAIAGIAEDLTDELSNVFPGAALMIDLLAHKLLVHVLRAYLTSGEKLPVGWLGALAEPRVRRTLESMHRSPDYRWSLEVLARDAGMSRSAFSALFKRRVGVAPLDYLLRWRMQLATKMLRAKNQPIGLIAFALGYGSESAFGNAFKRIMGKAPGQFQREA